MDKLPKIDNAFILRFTSAIEPYLDRYEVINGYLTTDLMLSGISIKIIRTAIVEDLTFLIA